jgi:hypothetical protein
MIKKIATLGYLKREREHDPLCHGEKLFVPVTLFLTVRHCGGIKEIECQASPLLKQESEIVVQSKKSRALYSLNILNKVFVTAITVTIRVLLAGTQHENEQDVAKKIIFVFLSSVHLL